MEHYYEVQCDNNCVQSFDSLEDAISHADKFGYTLISEIGGCWTDFEKCSFCGEWFDCNELNKDGECERCEQAIKDHGEK